ncbi:hypothetical protein BDV12DRAFT_182826 [Aspergillus spectabilis]
MFYLEDKVFAAKDRHSQILTQLKPIEHAADTLKSHEARLLELQRQLRETNHQLQQIENVTKFRHAKYEKFTDNTNRQLMYRVAGKKADYEARADKRMKDYQSALEREGKIYEERKMLQTKVAEANEERESLRAACEERSHLLEELDYMYGEIFNGRTPECPEEDSQEAETNTARNCYYTLNSKWLKHGVALKHLIDGYSKLSDALESLRRAFSLCSDTDKMGLDEVLADSDHLDSLVEAREQYNQANWLVSRAKCLDYRVKHLPILRIVQPEIIVNLARDNSLCKARFLDMVRKPFNEMKLVEEALMAEINQARSRGETERTRLEEAESEMESAERALRQVREQAFLKIATPPPPYTKEDTEAICEDKLPTYC